MNSAAAAWNSSRLVLASVTTITAKRALISASASREPRYFLSSSRKALNGCLDFKDWFFSAASLRRCIAKRLSMTGCSAHRVPSLSNVAIRSSGATKSGVPRTVNFLMKAIMSFFGAVSLQDGSGSDATFLAGSVEGGLDGPHDPSSKRNPIKVRYFVRKAGNGSEARRDRPVVLFACELIFFAYRST